MFLLRAQSPFEALVESIIYQQLHGKAAATIHRRLLESFYLVTGNEHFAAQHLLDCPNEQLRAAGLSHNKSLALRDLAAKTLDGTVPTLTRIRRMADEDIIEHLTQVRGIGRWTVEMLLIYSLVRTDVLPGDDFGVREGYRRLKSIEKAPSPRDMREIGQLWAPHRTAASWYLWQLTAPKTSNLK